jgi:predicted nucleic acid-binding protein
MSPKGAQRRRGVNVKHRVYLETTIVSYLTARPSRDLILAAHQEVTRQWWEGRRRHFEVYVSQLVVDEAGRGDIEAARKRREALEAMVSLAVTEDTIALAAALTEEHALPSEAGADALHIAVATVNGMDFLMTWNCRHIANVELLPDIRRTVEGHGYELPWVCTPEELSGGGR